MSEIVLAGEPATRAKPPRKSLSTWQVWGIILIAPYLLVFLVFVLYPVTYGLWLARNPASYQKLFEAPVFFPTVVNPVVFLLVSVNLPFLLALFLSPSFLPDPLLIPSPPLTF